MAFQQGETVTVVGKFQNENKRVCDDSRPTWTLSSMVRRPGYLRVVGLFVAERGFRNVFRIFCNENGIILIIKCIHVQRQEWKNNNNHINSDNFILLQVEPDWRLEDVFVYEVHQLALDADQSPMHAISGSVETPEQIQSMFDDISYSKAGAVLRMLQYVVTEDNFKRALNLYLTKNEWELTIFRVCLAKCFKINIENRIRVILFRFKAATPEELWDAIENVLYDAEYDLGGNVTVTEFMRSWTEQAGYPLVEVVKENDAFVITQVDTGDICTWWLVKQLTS